MRFKGLKKVHEGRFISRYDLEYETKDGRHKIYEMVSRNSHMESLEDVRTKQADSVVMIMLDEKREKILLNKEYRMACGGWVYHFPAGLIDPGETAEESARRELREETGLEVVDIEDVIPASFGAVGFSNEKNLCIVGTARGDFQKSTSPDEEIQAAWYSKEEVRRLIRTETFAGRAQAWVYVWAHDWK